MWSSLLAFAYKEIRHMTRDPGWAFMFTMILALDFVALAFVDFSRRETPTVIVDQDHSVESRELIGRVLATNSMRLKYATSSVEQAREHIRAGRAKAAVVIPSDYSRQRAGGLAPRLLVLVDGSDANVSSETVAAMEGITNRLNTELVAPVSASVSNEPAVGTVSSEPTLLFNPQGKTSLYMLPAMIAFNIFAFLMMCAESFEVERMNGTLERLLMTPLDVTGLIVGKVAPYAALGTIYSALFLLVIRWVFGVPIRGSVFVVFGGATLYVMTMIALGLYIISNLEGLMADIVISVITTTTFFATGYFFPVNSLPWFLRIYAYAHPATHIIEIMRGVCLRGAGLFDLLPHFTYLAIMPVVLVALSARRLAASITAA
jgi:ABC-2 type transport system permease protein